MSSKDSTDCVVIGAGIVGIAVAREIAMTGRDVVVLEKEPDIGQHTSSRNSEVIHAGIYYPPGSLKATLCVAGRESLYAYCDTRHVAYRRIGKLIVATGQGDEAKLHALAVTARQNGVDDLQWRSSTDVAKLEPSVKCRTALWSPSTGIVDSHALMLALRADLEAANGIIVCRSPVSAVRAQNGRFALLCGLDGNYTIECSILINAAGLWAPQVASTIDGLRAEEIPQARYAKAHYFAYQGKSPFSRLIYPLPDEGGLGIHATLDLGGSTRFGPDVEWVQGIDYRFDDRRKSVFAKAIQRYFPDLDPARLLPDYTGIRPKLTGPGEAAADFVIQGPAQHGISGLVNLYGIESPGLTASLAIARFVLNECQ